MPMIEDTSPVRWLIVTAPVQRRPYIRPTVTLVGTFAELLLLREAVTDTLPHLIRLAQESNRPFTSLSDYIARTNRMSEDLAAVERMVRTLGGKPREVD